MGKWMAAVLACGDGALLSHQSAATLHGLLNAKAGRVHVTVPRRTTVARAGIRVHRSTCLVPQDRVKVDGIACTSVPATLLSVAATAPPNVLTAPATGARWTAFSTCGRWVSCSSAGARILAPPACEQHLRSTDLDVTEPRVSSKSVSSSS